MSERKPVTFDQLKTGMGDITPAPVNGTESQDNENKGMMQYVQPPYIYGIIPVVIAAALWYMKPGFIMETVGEPDEDNPNPSTVLSYKKLGIATAVCCVVIGGAWYYYNGRGAASTDEEK